MDYYEPQGLALDIFRRRYAIHEGETFGEACDRVAYHVAQAEQGEKIAQWKFEFSEVLKKNLFFPGGRIMYGSGRPKGQLLNCFVIPTQDSREGWGKSTSDMIVIAGTGGGMGMNGSPIRPRGSAINGAGGTATGAVSLFHILNAAGEVIKGGGGRRVALMLALEHDHGDIVEFLDEKLDLEKLNNANVSVVFQKNPEVFFEKVKKDEEYDLFNRGKLIGKLSAKKIWHKIIGNALKNGEPGVLNGFLANKMSNIGYYTPLICTNPCITGDSLIAVADGRNAVSIGQLASEKKDVPIYSTNIQTGRVEIKMGRNPRKTGEKKEIWKLTLDDGSVFRATPDHHVLLRNLRYVKLKDLKPGNSIFPFNSFNSNGYRQICDTGAQMTGGAKRNRRQYRLIHEFVRGLVDAAQFAIHHDNYDSLDDRPENLRVLTHEDHRRLHADRMKGEANPYHLMDNEQKRAFASHPGESNGRYIDVSNEQLLNEGRWLFAKHGKLTYQIWVDHAKANGLPQMLANEFRFGTFSNFRNQIAFNHKVISVEFCGYEDVFNITVDDNHNYHVITNADERAIVSSGICVKNCGEIWLSAYDSCDLGSLVLPRFVNGNDLDWDLLRNAVAVGVRFLDNVLTVNNYPLPEIKDQSSNIRRLGLGITGLHDMLLKLGLKYNSAAGLEFVDKVMERIKNWAYESSSDIAAEKGSFPKFDPDQYLKGGFAKTLKPSIREKIRERGMRNCAVLTVAPVGTGSMVCDTSSGIEPMFAPAYQRRYRDGDKLREEVVIHPLFKRFMDEGRSVRHFQGAHDLKLKDHFEMQRVVQRHIDNAVSKTLNIPSGVKESELSDLYMEYFPELKGVTVYPEGSRENQPLTPMDLDEAIGAYKKNAEVAAAVDDKCRSGVCEL